VEPGRVETPGPMGLTRFRHPARIALEDLVYLAVSVSDNVAADALFDLVGPEEVSVAVAGLGVEGVVVRHRMRDLARTPAEALGPEDAHLAHALAIGAGGADDTHAVVQLDVARASVATARGLADLLQELWRPRRLDPGVAAQVRSLLAANVVRHRLAPDFASDDMRWSSKTGTLLHLRHEAGVVDHADGQQVVLVALTASTVPAAVQPGADVRMAAVARRLHDRLRR
jgi:beta-lactamase class A